MSTASPPAAPAPAAPAPAAPSHAYPSHARPSHAQPPQSAKWSRGLVRRARSRAEGLTTPGTLKLMLAGLIILSLGWGAAAAWTVAQRSSGAGDVVAASEPLSYDAQQIYQSLSDADATAAAAFLAGGLEPPAASARYLADIARAASYLEAATAESGEHSGRSQLATLATDLPVYTGLIEAARADNRQGLPVGAAYLREASNLMRTRLLSAARSLYAQENSKLAAADRQATGLPVLVVLVSLIVGYVLVRAQRWLTRRTHRVVNYGLLTASAVGVIALVWLIAGVTVARVRLLDARDHGSAPVAALAQADISALRAHADESLTLIGRSGDDSFQADFLVVQKDLGPGPGTLLSTAADTARGSPGAVAAQRAAAQAPVWFGIHRQVRRLDDSGNYNGAVQLAIGSAPASSATAFRRLEASLTTAISADQAAFSSSARSGRDALAGLEAGMIVASIIMAAGCAYGLARRIAEYQ
jgi:hypothetical protein